MWKAPTLLHCSWTTIVHTLYIQRYKETYINIAIWRFEIEVLNLKASEEHHLQIVILNFGSPRPVSSGDSFPFGSILVLQYRQSILWYYVIRNAIGRVFPSHEVLRISPKLTVGWIANRIGFEFAIEAPTLQLFSLSRRTKQAIPIPCSRIPPYGCRELRK